MSTFGNMIDSSTGATRQLARVHDVLGHTALTRTRVGEFVRGAASERPLDVRDGLGTVVGGVAGAFLWKRRRVIGAVAGASLGRNLPALLNPSLRRDALVNMGITGTAVAASVALGGKSTLNRFVYFGVGWIGAHLAAYVTGLRR